MENDFYTWQTNLKLVRLFDNRNPYNKGIIGTYHFSSRYFTASEELAGDRLGLSKGTHDTL